jgi:hypothetical protein
MMEAKTKSLAIELCQNKRLCNRFCWTFQNFQRQPTSTGLVVW